MRPIDADALPKKEVTTYQPVFYKDRLSLKKVRKWVVPVEDIEAAPTVEAAPVVQGRWEDNHCTVCGMMPMGDEIWEKANITPPRMELFMDFCPTCGAMMNRKEGAHV